MHMKNKKMGRFLRSIAMVLCICFISMTMMGMALADDTEGDFYTDVPDTEPTVVEIEIVPDTTEEPDTAPEIAAEPENTEPEVTPEPEAESDPIENPEPTEAPEPTEEPEPTEPPVLECEYELDTELPEGWYNEPVSLIVRILDILGTGWNKVEAALSDEADAERIDLTEELREKGFAKYIVSVNGTVFFFVTDPNGDEHKLELHIGCLDYDTPSLNAGINGGMLHVEAGDTLSGIAAIYVNDDLYTTLHDGELNLRIDKFTDEPNLYICAVDNAGNTSRFVVLANPFYEEPKPEEHNDHCPPDCDCRKTTPTPGNNSGNSGNSGNTGNSGSGGGNAGASPGNTSAPTQTSNKGADATPQPQASPEPVTIEEGTGFSQNGSAVTRDLLYDKHTNKQFITVETRNGETFYIVIDYDKASDEDGEQYETYFLNLVDEADLLALVEGDTPVPTCTCANKCEIGAVNTSCEICRNNMSECMGKVVKVEPEPTVEPEPEPEKESGGSGPAILIILLLVGGAGALYWFKFRNKKPDTKGPVDLDDYDYGEDDEDEEYEMEQDDTDGAAEQDDE